MTIALAAIAELLAQDGSSAPPASAASTATVALSLGIALFLVAVMLVGFWMVMGRMRLLEDRIRELPPPDQWQAPLEPLRAQLDLAATGIGKVQEELRLLALRLGPEAGPDRPVSQADLKGLQLELAAARDELKAVRDEWAARWAEWARAQQHDKPGDPPVADLVRRHLEKDGYEDVRLISELESESGRMGLEARRRGVLYKGHAVVADGKVESVTLHPAYGAFP